MCPIGGTELDCLGFPKTRSSGTAPHANWPSLRSFLEPDLWHIFWAKLLIELLTHVSWKLLVVLLLIGWYDIVDFVGLNFSNFKCIVIS